MQNLHDAGERAGVQRMVVISIIGCDRFAGGYGRAKAAHERAALAGSTPTRILRAAQFHEFVGQLVDWGRQGDVSYVPRMRTQPVAARAVAQALVEMAVAHDWRAQFGDAFPEIAGPREERLVEIARLFAARRGDPVRVEESSDPNDPDASLFESGALLPGPHAVLAGPTFQAWLTTVA
jgi:hypothetical protein